MKILNFIKKLFSNHHDKIRDAVVLTQWLKKAIDSKTALFIVDVIGGDKDNAWRDKKSKQLATVLKKLMLIQNIAIIAEKEAKYIHDNRKAWLPIIASELLQQSTGINESLAIDQTQEFYELNKKFL
jgi:hypothetical protein